MIGLLHRQLLTKHRLRRGGCVAVSADLATLPTPGPELMRGSAALCDRLPFLRRTAEPVLVEQFAQHEDQGSNKAGHALSRRGTPRSFG